MDSIRPSSDGDGLTLAMPFGVRPDPSVVIDLDEPDVEDSFVNVYKLALPGNLATVKVSIKTNDGDLDFSGGSGDSDSEWDFSAVLPVDTATGIVSLPISWHTGDDDMIPVGKIQIIPLTSWDDRAEDFIFKVDLQGCYCKTSEYMVIYLWL